VILMCTRFGCRDPQWMVNALRCTIQGVTLTAVASADPAARHVFETFLHKIQVWQSIISNVNLSWTGKNGFLQRTMLEVEDHPSSHCSKQNENASATSPFRVTTCCTTTQQRTWFTRDFVQTATVPRSPGCRPTCGEGSSLPYGVPNIPRCVCGIWTHPTRWLTTFPSPSGHIYRPASSNPCWDRRHSRAPL
jgi:hypothetical protein